MGQLGLVRSGGGEPLPQRADALSGFNVCSVAAGERRSCAVTAAGELFTWGYGGAGQLEHSDTADQLAPRHVEALQGEFVVVVSAGGNHNIAATRGGSVFGWEKASSLGLQGEANVWTCLYFVALPLPAAVVRAKPVRARAFGGGSALM